MKSAYARKLSLRHPEFAESGFGFRRPPRLGNGRYAMPDLGSSIARLVSLNCGSRRDPGKRRTSAIATIPWDFTRARKSSHDRLEWPTVKSVGAGLGVASDIDG
jgi:hypothetical protein